MSRAAAATTGPDDRQHSSTGSAHATAVLYLRVSTKEQAHRNGLAEGYSLPAQPRPVLAAGRHPGSDCC